MKTVILLLLAAGLAAAATVNYTYDAAGRLVKADYGPGGSITYNYDKAGNLVGRVVASAAVAAEAGGPPSVQSTANGKETNKKMSPAKNSK